MKVAVRDVDVVLDVTGCYLWLFISSLSFQQVSLWTLLKARVSLYLRKNVLSVTLIKAFT